MSEDLLGFWVLVGFFTLVVLLAWWSEHHEV